MYKATISFAGVVSMTVGEVGEISNPTVAKDLLKAGYIVEVKDEKKPSRKKNNP